MEIPWLCWWCCLCSVSSLKWAPSGAACVGEPDYGTVNGQSLYTHMHPSTGSTNKLNHFNCIRMHRPTSSVLIIYKIGEFVCGCVCVCLCVSECFLCQNRRHNIAFDFLDRCLVCIVSHSHIGTHKTACLSTCRHIHAYTYRRRRHVHRDECRGKTLWPTTSTNHCSPFSRKCKTDAQSAPDFCVCISSLVR